MNNNFKYGLIGSSGRLGGQVINVFNEKGNELVFEVDINGRKQTGEPQILIDCSLPDALQTTVGLAEKFNSPLVIATTGLNNDHFNKLKELSRKVTVVQSFNFSVGVQVLLKLTEIARGIFKDWDVEITETHHRFKKDKPSGTALMIKDKINSENVNISSLRLGNIVGDHTVTFGGLGETVSISHHAISRRTFAEGILKSAEFALTKKNGFYSFKEVVFQD